MIVLIAGCGGNPYLDASLKPAEMEGKDKAWFEKNWGAPSGKAPRFFGGEEWTYFRIAGGRSSAIRMNSGSDHGFIRASGRYSGSSAVP